jgi:dephospho-CoA kinase
VLRIGLTGGIACGKSEVVRRLSAAGLPTLDLDTVSHELTAPGEPGYEAVVEAFGPSILAPDRSIDRRALGALVFADPAARQRLNLILHPRIRAEEDRRARLLGDGPGTLMVTDAALLVETGMHLRFDRLVVVHCRPDQQVARLRAREGLTEEAARARLAAQMPVATKVRFAHIALDASLAVEDTRRAADALAVDLEHLSRHRLQPVAIAEERARRVLAHGPVEGPRGLTPALLSEAIAAAGGVDLGSLLASLRPRAEGPWYEAAEAPAGHGPGPSPAALAGPLVLHELRERGFDPERLAAAAFSLAWLTDREESRLASSVLYALLLAQVLVLGRIPSDLMSHAAGFEALARRWAGSGPDPLLDIVVRAALAHPSDVGAARAFCASQGGDAGLVGGLVGSLP